MNNVDSLFFRGDLSGRSTDNALFSFGRSAGEDAVGDSYAFMRVGGVRGSEEQEGIS